MSDEEKKAIDELKEEINKPVEVQGNKFNTFILYNIESAKTILNLIEKQQKEIEELKEYKHDAELTKVACCTAQNCEALNNCIKLERELQNANKKWKDKIKAKIEEIKKYKDLARDSIEERIVIADSDSLNYGRKEAHEKDIEVLQSLLEKE